MSARIQMRNRWPSPFSIALIIAGLVLVVSVGCSSASTQPTEQPTPSATEPQAAPATLLPTATSEVASDEPIPAGWVAHTSQRCEYTIGYPSEMQITREGEDSQTLGFKLENPEEGARNFIYVSVVDQENQRMGEEVAYNYDPAEVEILLNMQAGESKALRDVPDEAPWTYQRMPDTTIGGYAAQSYENLQPWEFPGGTKEMRYLLALNGCTYLIGGYLDTTGSNQAGAIGEGLFNQIVATIQLMP